jgi:hypothetical protein
MNPATIATVRQLLDIAPVVFATPHFAIKGGTALNLFLHDLPRLSVDIDVVFTDHSLDREAALQAIAAELSAISQKLEAMGYEVRQRRNSASNESKLMVIGPLAEVKVFRAAPPPPPPPPGAPPLPATAGDAVAEALEPPPPAPEPLSQALAAPDAPTAPPRLVRPAPPIGWPEPPWPAALRFEAVSSPPPPPPPPGPAPRPAEPGAAGAVAIEAPPVAEDPNVPSPPAPPRLEPP